MKQKAYCIKITLMNSRVIAKGFSSEEERDSALVGIVQKTKQNSVPMKIEYFEIWKGQRFQWSRVILTLVYDSIPKPKGDFVHKIMDEIMFNTRMEARLQKA